MNRHWYILLAFFPLLSCRKDSPPPASHLLGTASDTSSLDFGFYLQFATADTYIPGSSVSCQVSTIAGIRLAFSDSAILNSYPFEYYGNSPKPALSGVYLDSIPVGSTQPFTVVWLDQTYTGTISRPVPQSLSYSWDNTSPVRVQ